MVGRSCFICLFFLFIKIVNEFCYLNVKGDFCFFQGNWEPSPHVYDEPSSGTSASSTKSETIRPRAYKPFL